MKGIKAPLGAISKFKNNNETNALASKASTSATGTATTTAKKPKKSQFFGYVHAFVMLFCFAVLLGTTYTEQRPYTYSSSHQALMIAVKETEARSVTSVDDIWKWVINVVSNIGGEGIESINANCQYDTFNTQQVQIDGVTYTLGQPSYDTSACDANAIPFITGSQNEVYLTGNHQLLSFGIFSMRSVPQYPVEKSIKNAKESFLKIRSTDIAPLDPKHDDKIVEICDANWGKCLHRDGFSGHAGSTFNWVGRVVDGYHTFEEGSRADMILPPSQNTPISVNPCYTFKELEPTSSPSTPPSFRRLAEGEDEDDKHYIAQPGNPSFQYDITNVTLSNCEYKWVSTGSSVRMTCLLLKNMKPLPLVAYMARTEGLDSVTLLLTRYFGCNSLFSTSSDDIKRLYVSSNKCLESNILGNLAYGVFFSTKDQDMWIRQSVTGVLQLQAHNYIDENTRLVRIYLITRSLGREQLFYTMITVEFQLNTDGSIVSTVKASYVPMVMFQYGYYGYEWRIKDVFRLEIMMLIIFVLFTLREIYQLVTKRLAWIIPERLKKICQIKGVTVSSSSNTTTTVTTQNGVRVVSVVQSKKSGNAHNSGSGNEILNQVGKRSRSAQIIPMNLSSSSGMSPSTQVGNNNSPSENIAEIIELTPRTQQQQQSQQTHPTHQQLPTQEDKNDDHEEELQHHHNINTINTTNPHNTHNTNHENTLHSPHNNSGVLKPSELLSPNSSDHLDVEQLVDDVNEMVDEIGDVIEDIIDDYIPDSDGIHDMLDWTTIVVITIAIIYRIQFIKSAALLHIYLMDLEEERTYDQHMEEIVAKFAHIQTQDQAIHLISIAVIAIGMLQFFRYLSFNKRFGIVTTTIAASTGDLLPVLIIFVSIVIAYAILASEIYGIHLEEYSTVQSSLAALFIVLLGNFDYYSMESVSPVETAIFFWSFVVVILFILLNMVLAVIFTVYDEKNQEIRLKEEQLEKQKLALLQSTNNQK